ncbi:hypothetical protein [Caulobacter sp. NIBR2454]|uniref:hypothetical protein n=1 Tax=Caulobacter sp. NIBR2454 TaxID=3015996 RepID=UPI0022B70E39|nr:hypothetical protein [Caulobacter sp. NIBR2454]
MTPEFEALSREAGIAAAAIGQGINGINKATYAEKGYYHYAFFNLSIALERLGKLIFILDYLVREDRYPSDKELRALGHQLSDIIQKTEEIRQDRNLTSEAFPDDLVSSAIVQVLSQFATSTRYYNLDYLVGGKSAAMQEPIAAWYHSVSQPILSKHYSARQRARNEAQAQALGALLDDISSVHHTAEDGRPIRSWSEGALATGSISILQKFSRMYCLRLFRSLTDTLGELQNIAMRARYDIPYLTDFFGIFNNDDSYFLSRKTWDPYRP